MATLYTPQAEIALIPQNGGSFAPGYPYRLVLHDTESHNYLPTLRYPVHFQADPVNKRLVQLMPLDQSGFGLEHVGAVETNRACAIQVEIDAVASEQPWPVEWVDWLGQKFGPLMRMLGITSTIPADLTARMSDDVWKNFNGVCGHRNVPDQPSGHWDPGNFDYNRFLLAANGRVNMPQLPVTFTDQGDGMKLWQVSVGTDGNGNGWRQTNLSWDAFCGATAQGPAPEADGYIPIPRVGAQQRGGDILLSVEGGPSNSRIIVWVSTT